MTGFHSIPAKEYRTARIQLVTEPSTYEKLRAVSNELDISFNEMFNQIAYRMLDEYEKEKRKKK